MKITDYDKVTSLVTSNIFLLDGDSGTKTILAHDLAVSLQSLLSATEFADGLQLPSLDIVTATDSGDYILLGSSNGNVAMATEDVVFALLDQIADVNIRRNIFRGKNLGTAYTTDQKAVVAAGTFKGMFCGDYWNISRIHRIVDFDYYYGQGDTVVSDHHFVTMPDVQLYTTQMNSTNITTGAYVGSEMYGDDYLHTNGNLANAVAIMQAAFGSDFLLKKRLFLANAATNGYETGRVWTDSICDLPTEPQMYGGYVMATMNSGGGNFVYRHTVEKSQLALMRINPFYINPSRNTQWLQDVVSATAFAIVYYPGHANSYSASHAYGVRCPVAVKGAA